MRLIIQQSCKVALQDVVILGISGGPDSLCLLDILAKLGQKLIVAHLDHGLRESSSQDAQFVAKQAQARSCPFVSERVDVSGFAAEHGLSIEDAARRVRYQFLFAQARQHHAKAVVVGHNADDQAETILMHVLRGSGLEGLRGMPLVALPNAWSAEIALIRPLLGFQREQIQAYLDEQGLVALNDETNQDTVYLRNRLRNQIIPELVEINPGLYGNLLRLGEIARGDGWIIDRVVEPIWEQSFDNRGDGYIVLRLNTVASQPKAIQRRLLRMALNSVLNSLEDVDFESVDRAVAFLATPTRSRRMDWLQHVSLFLENEQIWIVKDGVVLPSMYWPQMEPGNPCQLLVPGSVVLARNWVIHAELVDINPSTIQSAVHNQDSRQAWLDAAKISEPITVRSRRPGDRFRPLGMAGRSTKLSDFMINHQMPARARQAWPLVFSGDELLWVPGYQPADFARVTPSTLKLLHLHLVAPAENSGAENL